jgi:hypothetical protein
MTRGGLVPFEHLEQLCPPVGFERSPRVVGKTRTRSRRREEEFTVEACKSRSAHMRRSSAEAHLDSRWSRDTRGCPLLSEVAADFGCRVDEGQKGD